MFNHKNEVDPKNNLMKISRRMPFYSLIILLISIFSLVGYNFMSGQKAWQPDGEWIIFSCRDFDPYSSENTGIYRIRPDGSDLELINDVSWIRSLEVSPDGTWVFYLNGMDTIHRMRPNGNEDEIFLEVSNRNNAFDVDSLRITPNGENLYYVEVKYLDGISADFLMKLDLNHTESEPEIIYQMPHFYYTTGRPDPTETRFFFELQTQLSDPEYVMLNMPEEILSALEETDTAFINGLPVWSSNEKWILVSYKANDRRDIMLMKPDGTEVTNLTENLPEPIHDNIAWSPDAESFAFTSGQFEHNHSQISVMSRDGQSVQSVVSLECTVGEMGWLSSLQISTHSDLKTARATSTNAPAVSKR